LDLGVPDPEPLLGSASPELWLFILPLLLLLGGGDTATASQTGGGGGTESVDEDESDEAGTGTGSAVTTLIQPAGRPVSSRCAFTSGRERATDSTKRRKEASTREAVKAEVSTKSMPSFSAKARASSIGTAL